MQSNSPVLSICVPSRNRQKYFQETIKGLTASNRDDVEFVFVDNSDDPSVMNSFIEPYLSDPRIRYVPTGDHVRPMMENWEIAAHQTHGRWVTFIGDDDFMDPDAAALFLKIEAADPRIDAIDWAKISYFWPDENRKPVAQAIPLQTEIHRVPKSLLQARAYQWQSAKQVLVAGFSIYHSAISRRLLDRIRKHHNDRFFEHPIVDYDSLLKNITHGEHFVHVCRPLSVLGVCPLSNTASLGNRDIADKMQKAFHKEHAVSMDDWECYKDYPFKSRHGVTACIGMTHHWFSKTYGHNFTGFEANFAQSCAIQCNQSANEEQFKLFADAYRETFRTWKGGKYLKYFNPQYRPAVSAEPISGYREPHLYVMERSPWSTTTGDFYQMLCGFLVPVDAMPIDLDSRMVDVSNGAGRQKATRAAGINR